MAQARRAPDLIVGVAFDFHAGQREGGVAIHAGNRASAPMARIPE
jgi:hypothetical protein